MSEHWRPDTDMAWMSCYEALIEHNADDSRQARYSIIATDTRQFLNAAASFDVAVETASFRMFSATLRAMW